MAAEIRRRGPGLILPAVVYVLLYLALTWLSYAQPVLKTEITPWNPQTGLTVAFLLVYGPRLWPVTVVAAFASEMLIPSIAVSVPLSAAACLWIGMIYGMLASVLRRLDLAGPLLSAVAAGRMAVATVAAALVVAVGGVGIFVLAGDVSTRDALRGTARYAPGRHERHSDADAAAGAGRTTGAKASAYYATIGARQPCRRPWCLPP